MPGNAMIVNDCREFTVPGRDANIKKGVKTRPRHASYNAAAADRSVAIPTGLHHSAQSWPCQRFAQGTKTRDSIFKRWDFHALPFRLDAMRRMLNQDEMPAP